VNNEARTQLFHQVQQPFAVADIEPFVPVSGDFAHRAFTNPAGGTFGAEKHRSVITVNTGRAKARQREIDRNVRSDRTAGATN
jgi:hypothetical protein